jgi:hypothetical protein
MAAAVVAITPTTPLLDREQEFGEFHDSMDFRDWVQANPDSCTRMFSIADMFDDDPVEISDAVADLQPIRCEVLVGYQNDFKYGANKLRDLENVIREDYRKIELALGIHGQANYTVGCTIKEDGTPFDVEVYDGVSVLVIPYLCRFYQSTS